MSGEWPAIETVSEVMNEATDFSAPCELHPWMTEGEVISVEREVLKLSAAHLDVLEWGSGGSTLHFTRFLRQSNRSYRWLSMEYNRVWHRQIVEATRHDPGVEVVLCDVGNERLMQRRTEMAEYVRYPSSLGRQFDVILVDGRKRRRCLLEAHKLLKPHGFVLLHDAQRPYYWCAMDSYPHGRFLTPGLWQGGLSQ